MLAADIAQQASIQDITEAADVGLGSFYNHFTSKGELFETAVADVLEEMGKLLDSLSSDVADPAAAFAQSVRLAGRMAHLRPEIARILISHGPAYMDSDRGLAPRALRDITAGIKAGRFRADNPKLALAGTAGSLLSTLHLSLTDPEFADNAIYDRLAEQLLRMLGLPDAEARALATAALPQVSVIEPTI